MRTLSSDATATDGSNKPPGRLHPGWTREWLKGATVDASRLRICEALKAGVLFNRGIGTTIQSNFTDYS